MKLDDVYNQTLRTLIYEESGDRVAILPGGFKPPHKGHFEALKYIIDTYRCTSAIIYIGSGERDGITAQQSLQIWKLYERHIGVPTEVLLADVTPVKSVYEYTDENKHKEIFVGAGEEDQGRYAWFEKHKDEFGHVTVVPIPPQFGRISGSATREKLQKGIIDFVPDDAREDEDKVAAILGL